MTYRMMFTFHLFFFWTPLCDYNGLCCHHLLVHVAVLSTPVVPESRVVPTHDRLFTHQPLASCRVFFQSTGDTMKGRVHRSSQHSASVLACFFSLLLATGAGASATRKVCHSPRALRWKPSEALSRLHGLTKRFRTYSVLCVHLIARKNDA